MWLQNTVRVQNCYVIILLIIYEDILIPRNPGDGWRMRIQALPGLVVRRPGFEANPVLTALPPRVDTPLIVCMGTKQARYHVLAPTSKGKVGVQVKGYKGYTPVQPTWVYEQPQGQQPMELLQLGH